MTQKEINKLLNLLEETKKNYEKECNEHIGQEFGKIVGANYMFRQFIDILKTASETESEAENEDN